MPLLHRMSVFVSEEDEAMLILERCLAVETHGSISPFRVTFLIRSELLFLEKNKHLTLLLACKGSVLKSMECEDEKFSQMFSMSVIVSECSIS